MGKWHSSDMVHLHDTVQMTSGKFNHRNDACDEVHRYMGLLPALGDVCGVLRTL